jgi:putative ABC transport system ATP-binding protein
VQKIEKILKIKYSFKTHKHLTISHLSNLLIELKSQNLFRMDYMLKARQLSKFYQSGGHQLTVLDKVSFEVPTGSTLAIVGPSGSGKTTLLGLCAGLDRASEGSVELNGVRLDQLNEDQRAKVRNQNIGFIFQNFQLMPTLTALENVLVPLELQGERKGRKTALNLLEKVGLGERWQHYPIQLSGGEQQRVSLARAFVNRPKILFADEPTGNLDEETGNKVEQLLFELNREAGTTLIIVTHDLDLAHKTQRIIRLRGGLVVEDQAIG